MEHRNCEDALDSLSRESFECADPRIVRQAVMCRVWSRPEPPADPAAFSKAVGEAWSKVLEKCPDVPAPAPFETWLITDQRGELAGAVTAYDTGEIDICYKGNCRNEFVVPGEQGDVVGAMQAILPAFGLTLTPEAQEED